jgi:hypothetical protein
MRHSLLLLLFLQLFFSRLFCHEEGAPALTSSQGGSLSSSGSFSCDDEESNETEVDRKVIHPIAICLSEEEEKDPLPTISALLNLTEEDRSHFLRSLSATNTERLLQKMNEYLNKKHEGVESSKKRLVASKILMFKKRTPFELLNQQVDEQTAVSAAAEASLEELQERRTEAEEIFEAMKLIVEGDHQIAQKEVDTYNAAVNLRKTACAILYARAEEANPLLRLARQTREKEAALEERRKGIEESVQWQIVSLDEFPRKVQRQPESSGQAGADAAVKSGWLNGIGITIVCAGGAVGSALVTGGRLIGSAIVDAASK